MANANKNIFVRFFKRYGYYLLFVGCLLALAFIIIFSVIVSTNANNEVEPVNSNVQITFISPVLNGTISKGYSDTELQYNQTLRQWEAHFGLDFCAIAGTDVVACYDGTVESVYSNTLEGGVVKINHGNGLVSVYKSLGGVTISEGTAVKKGDIIGQVSTSGSSELKDGDHVHFEVWKDGSRVDPSNYLDIAEK